MGIYEELGVRRVINADFPMTRLGGSVLPKEVQDAIVEPTGNWCSMWELEDKVGREIAKICGAEAAHVTCGAYAALVLSAATCIAGKDPEKMKKLPDTSGMKNEIIIQSNLLSAHPSEPGMYDRSMEVPGGRLVQIGHEVWGARPEDLEKAICERTAAIHFMVPEYPDSRRDIIPLEQVIELGHKHNVPIIVDAAGQTYPIDLLNRFTKMGADLVCYAAKYIQGPNSAGWVCGRKEAIETVALHSFVGQEAGGYAPRPGFYKSVGRGYKLDRQEIVATLAALRRWVKLDHYEERIKPALKRIQVIQNILRGTHGLKFSTYPQVLVDGIGYHQLGLEITLEGKTKDEALELQSKLRECNPSVWVNSEENKLQINALYLADEDVETIAESIKSNLRMFKN